MDRTSLLADEAGGRRLNAAEVRRVSFTSAVFGGFNAEQVTRFMARVAAELDLADDERRELEHEVGRLRQQLTDQPAPLPAPHLPPVEQQAVLILSRAQENADHLLGDAQRQAQTLVENGRRQREAAVADGLAQRDHAIRKGVEEAGREAARIAAQAPIDAQRMLAQYRGLAESVRAGLNANLQALSAAVAKWDEQERQSLAT